MGTHICTLHLSGNATKFSPAIDTRLIKTMTGFVLGVLHAGPYPGGGGGSRGEGSIEYSCLKVSLLVTNVKLPCKHVHELGNPSECFLHHQKSHRYLKSKYVEGGACNGVQLVLKHATVSFITGTCQKHVMYAGMTS